MWPDGFYSSTPPASGTADPASSTTGWCGDGAAPRPRRDGQRITTYCRLRHPRARARRRTARRGTGGGHYAAPGAARMPWAAPPSWGRRPGPSAGESCGSRPARLRSSCCWAYPLAVFVPTTRGAWMDAGLGGRRSLAAETTGLARSRRRRSAAPSFTPLPGRCIDSIPRSGALGSSRTQESPPIPS